MEKEQDKVLINLKKAQSLLGKIIEMKENNEYCVDLMQQNLAVLGLVKSANQMLLEGHLHNCFARAMKTDNEARKVEMIEEILKLNKLSNK